MTTEQDYMDAFTGLDAARYRLEVAREAVADADGDREWIATLWARSIRTGDVFEDTRVESRASTKAQAVLGVYSCALGNALASADDTSCDACGEALGLMGGRDAVTGRVVCAAHVTRPKRSG